MKDVSMYLQKRICEYNQKWKYQVGNDMASCIVEILEQHFIEQQKRIAQLPTQHQNRFLNLLNLSNRSIQRQYIRVFFSSEYPLELPSKTRINAQDKGGNMAVYELTQPLCIQNCHIQRMIYVDGDTQSICRIHDGKQKEITLSAHEVGEQLHGLYFHIPHMFEHNEDLAFDLCLSCDDTLWEYLLDPNRVKIFLQLKDGRIQLQHISRKEDALHIEVALQEEQRLQIHGLWIQGMDLSSLTPQHIWDASFLWHGSNLCCDHIFGEEQMYEREDVPLFGAPMRIFNSCYICENETLSNPEAMVTLHFNTSTKCIDQGMEILQSQEFRGIMRKLPLDIPIYDAYADLVVLEYFNGKTWCTLPNTQGIQTIFAQVETTSFQIRFLRPFDLKPCSVMGKFAYYLRFRLVKSEHLYQQPCHIHVPYISHVRFHYTMRQNIKAPQTFLYSQLHKEDITKCLGGEGCTLFSRLDVEGKAVFLGLDALDCRYPCTFYVDIKHSQANGSPLCIAYATQLAYKDLYIDDATDGLTHSGEITMMFPEHIEKTSMFEEEAYWLRLSFQDHEIQDVQINEIIWNTAILAQDEHPLETISTLRLEHFKNGNVHLLQGPYGYTEERTQKLERSRLIHQFVTRQHPLSLSDLKASILQEFLDIGDIVFLRNQNAYQEVSEDCHVIVFVKDMRHHSSLFHIRKKDILAYLSQYEACVTGSFIVEEPIFISVSIHAKCRASQSVLWQKQQALLTHMSVFLNPIKGGLFHKGIAIGERLDMQAFTLRCEKEIQEIDVLSWQTYITFQRYGKQYFYTYEDMPHMVGFLLVSGTHSVEMEGR